jgi:hypothetical protein
VVDFALNPHHLENELVGFGEHGEDAREPLVLELRAQGKGEGLDVGELCREVRLEALKEEPLREVVHAQPAQLGVVVDDRPPHSSSVNPTACFPRHSYPAGGCLYFPRLAPAKIFVTPFARGGSRGDTTGAHDRHTVAVPTGLAVMPVCLFQEKLSGSLKNTSQHSLCSHTGP